MLTCHFCDAELTDSLLQAGRCPNCGGQLRWEGDDEDPLATLRLRPDLGAGFTDEGFVKSGAAEPQETSAADPPPGEDLPTHEVVPEATHSASDDPVQEGGSRSDDGARPEPASHDGDRLATLSPEMLARVTSVWSRSVAAEAGIRPQQTIKTHGADTVEEHSLVIQTRRLGGYDRPLSPRSDYELIEVIGEGGVGVVYQARQNSIDRMVAVKMLKSRERDEETAHDKFLSEAVVTGELEHPNIVPIYDLGTNDDGALFYSMKRVVGTPWDVALPDNSLTVNIEILMKVCDAVAFAHSRGVVHRDLKPENVMLGGFGEVLVMDWGIAISTEPRGGQRDIRRSATMGGTPAYMAPEMATGPLETIGVASDVYLLAGILYEIVTGKTPHDGRTVMDCLYAAAANEIQPTEASGELLEIALSGMATDPADRFQSVEEFQAAIREYQSHSESIALSERARVDLQAAIRDVSYDRFARALFAYEEAASLWPGNEPAQEGVVEARRSYAEAALKNDDYELGLSLVSEEDSRFAEVYTLLHAGQVEQQQRQERIRGLKRMALWLALIVVFGGVVSYVQISKNYLQISSQKTTLQQQTERLRQQTLDLKQNESDLWDKQEELIENQEQLTTREGQLRETVANLEREQRRKDYEKYVADVGLAAEQIDENAFLAAQELLVGYQQSALVNYEWGRQQFLCEPLKSMEEVREPVRHVQFLTDGFRLLATDHGKYGLFHPDDDADADAMLFTPLQNDVSAIAISPDGRILAASTASDHVVHLFAMEEGRVKRPDKTLAGHERTVTSLQFSPDGKWLLSTSRDHTARRWDGVGDEPPEVLRGHTGTVWQGAAGAGLVATAGQDGRVIVWDDDGARVFYRHEGPVYAVAISPGGEWIASGGADGRVLVWRPEQAVKEDNNTLGESFRREAPQADAIELTGHRAPVRCLCFSPVPEDRLLLSGSDDNTLRMWDISRPEAVVELAPLRGHSRAVTSCAISADGQWALSGSDDGYSNRWRISDFRRTLTGHANEILAARLSRAPLDPPMIATAGRDRTAWVWTGDRPTTMLQAGHEYLASTVLALPGRDDYAITSGGDNTTRVWSLTNGQQLVLGETGPRSALAVSADGGWVLTGAPSSANNSSEPVTCAKLWRIWDETTDKPAVSTLAHTLKPDHEFLAEAGVQVTAVAINQEQEWYFVGDTDGVGRLWRGRDVPPVRLPVDENRMIIAAAFRPGRRLVVASRGTTVTQWDVASGTELLPLALPHNGDVIGMSVSRDGQFALTTSLDGGRADVRVVRLWDLDTATELWRLNVAHDQHSDSNIDTEVVTGFAPDRDRFFLGNLPGELDHPGGFRIYEFEPGGGSRIHPVEIQNIEVDNEEDSAWSAALSADGADGARLIALRGNVLEAWDIEEGQRVRLPPQSVVSSVDISPDARRVVSASWDREVRVWDVDSGRVVHLLRNGDQKATSAVRFSPDGRHILTAGEYGVALWSAADYQRLDTDFQDGEHAVMAADFSGNSRRIVGLCDDGIIRVWSRDSGRLVTTMTFSDYVAKDEGARDEFPTCCAMGPFGRQIAVGTTLGALVWPIADEPDQDTRQQEVGPPLRLAGHTSPVTSIAFSPDGRRVVTGSEDGTAKIWDVYTRNSGTAADAKQLLTLSRNLEPVTAVDFSADGTMVLTATRDGDAVLWKSIPVPPRVRTSTSRQEASDEAVRVDPGLVINAPNTPLFDDVTLVVEIENESTTQVFTSTDVATADSSTARDVLTLLLERQDSPEMASGLSPDGKVFVLAGKDSELAFSAADATPQEGQTVVAEVNGVDSTKLTVKYRPGARLPDVEAVARSIAFRPGSGRSTEMTVQYRITDPSHVEHGAAAAPAEIRIRVEEPEDDELSDPEAAAKESHERA